MLEASQVAFIPNWQFVLECSKCKKSVPEEGFYRSKKGKFVYSYCKECDLTQKKELRVLTPDHRFREVKNGAVRRGLEFRLTKEEFQKFWRSTCYYCGRRILTIGLDRVDNKKGYTIENVVSCCKTCNTMKTTQSQESFIHRCRLIVTRANERLSCHNS